MPTETTYPVQVLRNQTTALEAALSVCLADPSPGAVHRLRTSTRRVEAQLLVLAAMPGLPAHREPAAVLRRELRRLRRAGGAVRDLDVYRKHLEMLDFPASDVPSGGNTSGEDPLGSGRTALLDHLQARRELAAGKLRVLLTRRQTKAAGAAEDLLKALGGAATRKLSVRQLVAAARAVLHRDNLLSHFGVRPLDEDQLHSVRKLAKAARYMAETLPGSKAAADAALGFEAVQEAGGKWHDAFGMTRAARKYLGKRHPITARLLEERDRLLAGYQDVLRGLAAAGRDASRRDLTSGTGVRRQAAGEEVKRKSTALERSTSRKKPVSSKPTTGKEPTRLSRKGSGSLSGVPRQRVA